MDKNEFELKIQPLGIIKRATKGNSPLEPEAYEDTVFVPFHRERKCSDCSRMVVNRKIVFQKKFHKDSTEWIKKCSVCKEKTSGFSV